MIQTCDAHKQLINAMKNTSPTTGRNQDVDGRQPNRKNTSDSAPSTPPTQTVSTSAPRRHATDESATADDNKSVSTSVALPDAKRTRRQSQTQNQARGSREGPSENALHENMLQMSLGLCRAPEEFISICSEYTSQRTSSSTAVPSQTDSRSAFFGLQIPDIPIRDYISRLLVYAYPSPAAFIIAFVLMQRAAQKHAVLKWTVSNIHRLLLAAVITGAKLLDDQLYSMKYYTRVGGIPTVKETLRLELIFLKRLDNDISVTHKQFTGMWTELRKVRDELRCQVYRPRRPDDSISSQSVSAVNDVVRGTSEPIEFVREGEERDVVAASDDGSSSTATENFRTSSSSLPSKRVA